MKLGVYRYKAWAAALVCAGTVTLASPLAAQEITLRLTPEEINYIVRVFQSTPQIYDQWFPLVRKIDEQIKAQAAPPEAMQKAQPPTTPPPPRR